MEALLVSKVYVINYVFWEGFSGEWTTRQLRVLCFKDSSFWLLAASEGNRRLPFSVLEAPGDSSQVLGSDLPNCKRLWNALFPKCLFRTLGVRGYVALFRKCSSRPSTFAAPVGVKQSPKPTFQTSPGGPPTWKRGNLLPMRFAVTQL